MSDIRHDLTGFDALIQLEANASTCTFEDINIDMSAVKWFDADMCVLLGAILSRLNGNLNAVSLTNISGEVERILSKNGFLSHYGRKKIPDHFGTTIPYRRFDTRDDHLFAEYIEMELIHRSEIPGMSPRLLKKFRESIFEIFSNAVTHSKTELGIFSCGQFFPKRNRLNFSVTDLGIGICQNVNEVTGLGLSPEEAIEWATDKNNTTRQGSIPGGLGLKLLKKFIDINGGYIQIVSDAGYWRREKGETTTYRFSQPFYGTVVNIEIDTADTKSYRLSSEMAKTDIF